MPKMPLTMRLAREKTLKSRAEREMEEARNTGMLTDTLKGQLMRKVRGEVGLDGQTKTAVVKAKSKFRDRGLHASVGRFTDGALHVPKHVIAAVSAASRSARGTRGGRSGSRSSGSDFGAKRKFPGKRR
jgi:hypothetical protein